MDWAAQQIQVVWFMPPIATVPDAAQFWETLFETRPDSFNRVPLGPFSRSHASGTFGDGRFTLMAQPGRLDIVQTAAVNNGTEEPVADIESALARIVDVLPRISNFPCVRLALVVTAQQEVTDLATGRKRMSEMLPHFKFPQGSTDQLVQFNVRSKIDEWDINRVCRWSVSVQQTLNVNLAAGLSEDGGSVVDEQFFVLWQLDLNTLQAPMPFVGEQVRVRFENAEMGFTRSDDHDSHSGCGQSRAGAGWPRLRRRPSGIRLT